MEVSGQFHTLAALPPGKETLVHSNIISYLRLKSSSGISFSGFPTKILFTFFIPPTRATYHTHLILLDLITE
jgi:mannitol/fructose-specific phosphotransferase system IIA component (Ntr-type)